MKIQGSLYWTSVLVEGESFVVEAMLTLVSTGSSLEPNVLWSCG